MCGTHRERDREEYTELQATNHPKSGSRCLVLEEWRVTHTRPWHGKIQGKAKGCYKQQASKQLQLQASAEKYIESIAAGSSRKRESRARFTPGRRGQGVMPMPVQCLPVLSCFCLFSAMPAFFCLPASFAEARKLLEAREVEKCLPVHQPAKTFLGWE